MAIGIIGELIFLIVREPLPSAVDLITLTALGEINTGQYIFNYRIRHLIVTSYLILQAPF